MSKWTANEVKAIEAGGNTKASRLVEENCQKTKEQIVLILLRGLLNSRFCAESGLHDGVQMYSPSRRRATSSEFESLSGAFVCMHYVLKYV